MPYRDVKFHAGGYYHLYNRGNNFQLIFLERENYGYFLRQLREYLTPTTVEIIAYCLMPNHYHLLVRLMVDDLSTLMQPLILSYTKAINRRYARVGALFQGHFKAIEINRDEYLLHLSRYIHLNPVFAQLVKQPEAWEFSSYRESVGLREGSLPKPQAVLGQFSSSEAYRQFVAAYAESDRKVIDHLLIE